MEITLFLKGLFIEILNQNLHKTIGIKKNHAIKEGVTGLGKGDEFSKFVTLVW